MRAPCVFFCPSVNSNRAVGLLQLDSQGQPFEIWPGRLPLASIVAGEHEVGEGAGDAAPRG
jgi:hypothetical protein